MFTDSHKGPCEHDGTLCTLWIARTDYLLARKVKKEVESTWESNFIFLVNTVTITKEELTFPKKKFMVKLIIISIGKNIDETFFLNSPLRVQIFGDT